MFPLLFLVLVIYVLFLVFIGLARGLLILFIFSPKNQFLVSLIFSTEFLFSISLITASIFIFFSLANFALLFPVHSPLTVPLWSEVATSTDPHHLEDQVFLANSGFVLYRLLQEHLHCYLPQGWAEEYLLLRVQIDQI